MNLKRKLSIFLVSLLALSLFNLGAVPASANDPSHPVPMGLWAQSFGNHTLILTTNYESNTLSVLQIDDTFTIAYKEVLQTGRGPVAVTMDDYGDIYTANYTDSTVTQHFWNGRSESRTVQTGAGPNAISFFNIESGTTVITSNFEDNTISKIEFLRDPREIHDSQTITTDYGPMAINNVSSFGGNRLYWISNESNTLLSEYSLCQPCTRHLDELPWYEVRNGALVDSDDVLIAAIHPVGLVVVPTEGPDIALVTFEENSPGQPTKQHLWVLALGGLLEDVFSPTYIGEFDAPAESYTNQRIALNYSSLYILSSDGSTNSILRWNYELRTSEVIWSDAGLVAIRLDYEGNLYAANSLDNTVLKFNPENELIASYSMWASPPPAAPSFTLSSNSEIATVGSPITSYTIDSSAGGVVDIYDISPGISNGLIFDPATGLISGTPIAAASSVTYTITGINVTDTATATFTISVNAASSPPVNNIQQTTISVPDPIQMSSIDSFTALNTQNETSSVVTVYGKFVEMVLNIQVDGVNIPRSSWSQTSTTLTFTVNKSKDAKFTFTVFNGAAPVLPVQSATVTAAVITPPAGTKVETPTGKGTEPAGSVPATQNPSAVKAPAKIVAIKCVRGKSVRTVKAVKPKCPKGYVKK